MSQFTPTINSPPNHWHLLLCRLSRVSIWFSRRRKATGRNSHVSLLKNHIPSLTNLQKYGPLKYSLRCLKLLFPIRITIINLISEFSFDRRYHTNTSTIIPADELNFPCKNIQKNAVLYKPSIPHKINTALKYLTKSDPNITKYSFVDYGCGAGRVLILAAEAGFHNIIGVELSPYLLNLCHSNIGHYRTLNKACNISIVNQCATASRIPADACCFYFYFPFTHEIFDKVIENINDSLLSFPRTIYILDLESNYDFESKGYIFLNLVNGVKIYNHKLLS